MNFVALLKRQTHIFSRVLITVCLTLVFFNAASSPVTRGFKALSIYDYFLAKKYFYKAAKKGPDAYAYFGLATIYSRSDNPFHNHDSAAKYASRSYCTFVTRPIKVEFAGFRIDSFSILNLCDSVAYRQWHKIKSSENISDYNTFLTRNYLSSAFLREQALYRRDELEYNRVIDLNSSDSTTEFIRTHPGGPFFEEAVMLHQRQVYNEQTKDGTATQFIKFIERFPSNFMVNMAYENVYQIYRGASDVKGLSFFVSAYPKAPQNTEAWKLLFSLTVKSFSNSELEKFLTEFPSFPFRESILKELKLNKLILYPYYQNDQYGFIDSTAKLVIKNEYDAVLPFCEGLSVVTKNDSVFYINKENVNVFEQYYTEAYSFKNGIAAVKQSAKWYFVNRQGQRMPGYYDEINELSNDVYIVKINNKYGAVNHSGQVLIEPRFQKLGDFKNEFAYYLEDVKYGFVSKSGFVHKAMFDWISDFNEYGIAVIKENNLYGLINSQGEIILEPSMDLVVKAAKNIFITVKNGFYGFFSGSGCFVTQVTYDYLKEKPAEFYTNGSVFKLLKKSEQALIDVNGRTSIDFGTYDEVNFASCGLIRLKRKNKYGYADRKLSLVIPYKFQEAGDFMDSLAIVTLNDKHLLINVQGKEIYSSEDKITKLSAHYYLVGDEKKEVINYRGETAWRGVEEVQKVDERVYILTLVNKEIKLLRD